MENHIHRIYIMNRDCKTFLFWATQVSSKNMYAFQGENLDKLFLYSYELFTKFEVQKLGWYFTYLVTNRTS